jgi:hypothetical protein
VEIERAPERRNHGDLGDPVSRHRECG